MTKGTTYHIFAAFPEGVCETMEAIGALMLGLAAGWAARAGIDSRREAAVRFIAAAYSLRDFATRRVAVERENLEDLFAEARARYEVRRAPSAVRATPVRTEQDAADRAA